MKTKKKPWCYGKQDLEEVDNCKDCNLAEKCYNLTFKDYFENRE